MLLGQSEGARLVLSVVGYQYPDLDPRYPEAAWDANWLLVDCKAVAADGRLWAFRAPCLTTWEARSLTTWLSGIVEHRRTCARLTFTEPVLAFDLVERFTSAVLIRVDLGHVDALRRETQSGVDGAPERSLLIQTSDTALECELRNWRQATDRFPTR